jgi:hypothetical protein
MVREGKVDVEGGGGTGRIFFSLHVADNLSPIAAALETTAFGGKVKGTIGTDAASELFHPFGPVGNPAGMEEVEGGSRGRGVLIDLGGVIGR